MGYIPALLNDSFLSQFHKASQEGLEGMQHKRSIYLLWSHGFLSSRILSSGIEIGQDLALASHI